MAIRHRILAVSSVLLFSVHLSCSPKEESPPKNEEELTEAERAEIQGIIQEVANRSCERLFECFTAVELRDYYQSVEECKEVIAFETEYESFGGDFLTPACARAQKAYMECDVTLECADYNSGEYCQAEEERMAKQCFPNDEYYPDDGQNEEPTLEELHPGYAIAVEIAEIRCSGMLECEPEAYDELYGGQADCIETMTANILYYLSDPEDPEKEVVSVECAEAEHAFQTCVTGLTCEEQYYWWDTECQALMDVANQYCAESY